MLGRQLQERIYCAYGVPCDVCRRCVELLGVLTLPVKVFLQCLLRGLHRPNFPAARLAVLHVLALLLLLPMPALADDTPVCLIEVALSADSQEIVDSGEGLPPEYLDAVLMASGADEIPYVDGNLVRLARVPVSSASRSVVGDAISDAANTVYRFIVDSALSSQMAHSAFTVYFAQLWYEYPDKRGEVLPIYNTREANRQLTDFDSLETFTAYYGLNYLFSNPFEFRTLENATYDMNGSTGLYEFGRWYDYFTGTSGGPVTDGNYYVFSMSKTPWSGNNTIRVYNDLSTNSYSLMPWNSLPADITLRIPVTLYDNLVSAATRDEIIGSDCILWFETTSATSANVGFWIGFLDSWSFSNIGGYTYINSQSTYYGYRDSSFGYAGRFTDSGTVFTVSSLPSLSHKYSNPLSGFSGQFISNLGRLDGTPSGPSDPVYPTVPQPDKPEPPEVTAPTSPVIEHPGNDTTTTTVDLQPVLDAIRILNDNLTASIDGMVSALESCCESMRAMLDAWFRYFGDWLDMIWQELRTANRWLEGIFYKTGGGSSSKPDPTAQPDSFWRWLGNLLDSLVGELPDGDAGFADALSQLTGRFPFSVPWDMGFMLGLLSQSPQAPRFECWLPSVGPSGFVVQGYKLVVDLSAFDDVALVCRRCELLLFALGLSKWTIEGLRGLDWTLFG